MADYRHLIPHIRRWEGGYSNHPADPGGATMRGVTFATFKSWRRRQGRPTPTVDDLRNITDEEWGAIFKSLYWDRCKADLIHSQPVADMLVDWVWGSGVHAIRHTQRLLGVTADGVVGPKPLAAINSHPSPRNLWAAMYADRERFYYNIATGKKRVFLRGWLNRLHSMTYDD